jgi:hypothetical protein
MQWVRHIENVAEFYNARARLARSQWLGKKASVSPLSMCLQDEPQQPAAFAKCSHHSTGTLDELNTLRGKRRLISRNADHQAECDYSVTTPTSLCITARHEMQRGELIVIGDALIFLRWCMRIYFALFASG